MRKMSIKTKITLLALVPAFCFMLASVLTIKGLYADLQDANLTQESMRVMSAAGAIISSLQAESGSSIGLLVGASDQAALDAIREKTDKEIEAAKPIFAAYPTEENKQIVERLGQLPDLRRALSSQKMNGEQTLAAYSKMITEGSTLARASVSKTNLPGVALALQNVIALENARDLAGRVRSRFTLTFARNAPTLPEIEMELLKNFGGIQSSLTNLNAQVDPELRGLIKEFDDSAALVEARGFVGVMIRHGENGKYGVDHKKAYANVQGLMDRLSAMSATQLKYTEKALDTEAKTYLNELVFHVLFLMGIMVTLAVMIPVITKSISTGMANAITALRTRADAVAAAATQINHSSVELAEMTTELASSVQETVSSVNEIESMVAKNSEAAAGGENASTQSRDLSNHGKAATENMIRAIGEISSSNEIIVAQVVDSNDKLKEIARVISEISQKTRVINDIVFQTKLLSFNASVEAARAGEHGKGFAVVAEEVGNLAQMSGNAAKEISAMLDESVAKVNRIVQDTAAKVDGLVGSAKKTIGTGLECAQQSQNALGEITVAVGNVNEMVGLIASSSKEQSTGIREINKAMQEIDSVTQKNSQIANECTLASQQLKDHSHALADVVADLVSFTYGTTVAPADKPAPVAKVIALKPKAHQPVAPKAAPAPLKAAAGFDVNVNDDSGFVDV